jgi:cobalt-zinc-cadmium efflux system protein
VAAIVAAVVIMTTGWMPIDPILSVAVAVLILRSAWLLIRKSAHILLEGAPDDLDESDIKDRLVAAVPGVVDVHHIHIWGLTQEERMLTLHLKFCDEPEDATRLVRQAKKILAEEFDVSHSTIEVEIDECSDA